MKAKWLAIFILNIFCFELYTQAQSSLSKTLWNRVNKCYSNFEDMDDDGFPDFDLIDDTKNGFLHIYGEWPTCGCSCSSTVGAYKNKNGAYIFLQADEYVCSWEKKISSNKLLKDILPANFGINSFTSQKIAEKAENAILFANFDVPQKGTDTRVKLELIPFGIFQKGNNFVCLEYVQGESAKSLIGIRGIAEGMADTNTLNYLLKGSFDKINAADMKLISSKIREGVYYFSSLKEIQHYLTQLHKAYIIYSKLEVDELLLGWDKEKSKFYIKEKGKKISHTTFAKFLLANSYWDYMC